jgi:hypothetical protein
MNKDELLDYLKQQNIKCGFGWYGLIMSILENLKKFNSRHLNEPIKITCFNEKHGALSIETTGKYPDSLRHVFDKAMKASSCICECCGCAGKLKKRDDGKEKALCPRCGRKYKKGKKIKLPSADIFDLMKEQLIYCGYGWYGLIFPIIARMKKHNDKHPAEEPDEISSFEEKWGTLQIRKPGIPGYLEKLIVNAEEASESICMSCGCPGNNTKDSTGWYVTLCPDCMRIREEANNKLRLGINEEEQFNRKKYIEEKMPEFLTELSALTQKYEIKICEDTRCQKCPKVSDMDNPAFEYQKLEFSWSTGCYTLEGFETEQEENEKDTEDDC